MLEPWTLAGILRTHAAGGPDRPMITYGSRVITWGEMRARASRVAQALRGEGVGPQDRVAFVERNAPEYFEVLSLAKTAPGSFGARPYASDRLRDVGDSKRSASSGCELCRAGQQSQ
jgi:non-ribosomal peptide synthetase component E (peptide arylation enzyme)